MNVEAWRRGNVGTRIRGDENTWKRGNVGCVIYREESRGNVWR
jgi:hypothetical protein